MPEPVTVQPVILAGGSGTRLWPLSRGDYPKQLLNLDGDSTMLQATAARLGDLPALRPGARLAAPMVVAGEDLRFLVADQLKHGAAPRILLEPCARNTAPAIAAAARHASQHAGAGVPGDDADPVLVVMPADHIMRTPQAFSAAVAVAVDLCQTRDVVATFGIVASRPETGFGYLRRGAALDGSESAYALDAFVEKPDADTAARLLADGRHYWNGGIFVARASVLWRAVEAHAPAIATAVSDAVAAGSEDGWFFRLQPAAFARSPSDSIDYAVMEKLDARGAAGIGAVVVPLDAGWSDVGAWDALLDVLPADAHGNVVRGDVVTLDSRNSVQVATSRLLATLGIDGLVVVETPDAVFVAPREQSQRVKELVTELSTRQRAEASSHQKVYRPWGTFESLDSGGRYQVKRLTVHPGAQLSLQLHHHRAEHWVVVEGTARVTRGEEVFLLTENESTYLPVGIRHRLENPGKVPLEVIEVQSGSYLGEDDIVRFEDVYKRD